MREFEDDILELREEKESGKALETYVERCGARESEESLKQRLKDLEKKFAKEKLNRVDEMKIWDTSRQAYETQLDELSETLTKLQGRLEEKESIIATLQTKKGLNEEVGTQSVANIVVQPKRHSFASQVEESREEIDINSSPDLLEEADKPNQFLSTLTTYIESHTELTRSRDEDSSLFTMPVSNVLEAENELETVKFEKQKSTETRTNDRETDRVSLQQYDAREDYNKELQREVQEQRVTIEKLNNEINEKDDVIDSMQATLDDLEEDCEYLSSNLLALRVRDITHQRTEKVHKGDIVELQSFKMNNEKYLVSGAWDKTIKIFKPDMKEGTIVSKFSCSIKINALTYLLMNGKPHIACGGSSPYKIEVWNVETFQLEFELKGGHTNYINALKAYEENGVSILVSGSADGKILIWNLQTQTCVSSLTGHLGSVETLMLYQDVDMLFLASGGQDSIVTIWDLEKKTQFTTLHGHSNRVKALTTYTLDDSKYLVTGSYDKVINIWDLNDYSLEESLLGHTDYIYSLTTISYHDRPCLLSGGKEKVVIFWDLVNYSQIRSVRIPSGTPIWSSLSLYDEEEDIWQIVSGHCGGSIMWWSEKLTASI